MDAALDDLGTMPPSIRSLDRAEVESVLGRNHVARIAFASGNQIDIVPIHYVFTGDWIYGRTTPGSRLQRVGEHWWPVAFEVDEMDSLFDWRSVVVKGGLYVVPTDRAEWERQAWAVGVDALRKLLPEALTDNDPVPQRSVVFRIAVQEATGREASSR